MPRTQRSGIIVIGLPPSASTHLLRPKKEPGPGASNARVKEPGTPASFTRVKKEPDSFTRVKKEHDAPTPPSSEKARRLADNAARQLAHQAPEDTEEFPSQRAAECASLNKVQSGTLEFALAWSRQDVKKAEAERARRLSLCVNLEDDEEEDDAGPSQWRRGSGDGQGCSSWAAKDEPPSDDDDDGNGDEDYNVFYRLMSMN
jgi:hypothetical protein